MNFNQAIGEFYFREVIAELTEECYLDRWPTLAAKCKNYREAKLFCNGQTFQEASFIDCTILGYAVFNDCSFQNCSFFPMDGREAILTFIGGTLRNCAIGGKWNSFWFTPRYCKDVAFQKDWMSLDSTFRFNCPVSRGLIVPEEVWMRVTALMGPALGFSEYEKGSPLEKADSENRAFVEEYGETLDI